jgi:hypothetical protein
VIGLKDMFGMDDVRLGMGICPLGLIEFRNLKELQQLESQFWPDNELRRKTVRRGIASMSLAKDLNEHAYWNCLNISDPDFI